MAKTSVSGMLMFTIGAPILLSIDLGMHAMCFVGDIAYAVYDSLLKPISKVVDIATPIKNFVDKHPKIAISAMMLPVSLACVIGMGAVADAVFGVNALSNATGFITHALKEGFNASTALLSNVNKDNALFVAGGAVLASALLIQAVKSDKSAEPSKA